MAQGAPTRQFPSQSFVESCGAILFDLSDPRNLKICILHHLKKDEWLLAKGRRNRGEARKEAALRELMEEIGYRCHLYPVTMSTRAPPADEPANFPDKARVAKDLTEPFMFTLRELGPEKGVKIIWWFIAALDADVEGMEKLPGEAQFAPQFLPCDKAIAKLTFQSDRDVVIRAVELVEGTITRSSWY